MADLSGPGEFGTDDGTVPAPVADVLARRARGEAGIREVVAELGAQRLLVPLLEVDGDLLDGDDADPCAGSDRAVAAVSIREPDGTPVGLAFTGMAPLRDWDPAARPMPVSAARAAAAVLTEGGRALLLDVGSPAPVRIRGVALGRLATGEPWPEPWVDAAVRAAVVAELAPVLASGEVGLRLVAGAGSAGGVGGADGAGRPGLTLQVRFAEKLTSGVIDQRAAVIAERVTRSAALREVFDGVLAVEVVGVGVGPAGAPRTGLSR
ncbi:MAG: SseB family protein [Candidatus Nanopelagicales bacterium]